MNKEHEGGHADYEKQKHLVANRFLERRKCFKHGMEAHDPDYR